MSGTSNPTDGTLDGEEDLGPSPAEEVNVLGIVLVLLLCAYVLVGALALLWGLYGTLSGWILYPGRPYWVTVSWPAGAVGLLTPGLMELDDVTEVRRTPPVITKVIVGYGLTAVGFLLDVVLSFHPLGIAGLVATTAFTGLSLQSVRQRGPSDV